LPDHDNPQKRRRAERRRVDALRRAASFQGVVVVRQEGELIELSAKFGRTPEDARERAHMGEMAEREVVEDRQRVDRWLEEGQFLLGRIIPALLDDRERLRAKLEGTEQDCDRLRLEVGELRRQVGSLQGHFRTEQAAIAEAFGGVMDLLGQLHKPLSDINRRLQPMPLPSGESPA
jgi:hypothetical protein